MSGRVFARVIGLFSLFLSLPLTIAAQEKPALLGGGHGPPPARGAVTPQCNQASGDDAYNSIRFSFYCPVELLLTDSQGRRTGFDPMKNTWYEEIPGAGYENYGIEDAETGEDEPDPGKDLDVWGAADGDYFLNVIGTGTGSYSADIQWYFDYAGRMDGPLQELSKVPTAKDAVHVYLVHYENRKGGNTYLIGGFDGGGRRPKDVNRLLTYAHPSQSQTKLPPGTTGFPLMIFYAGTVTPSTLSAQLNGVSIVSLFHPAASGHETVSIPLGPGSNVLVLSIQGSVGKGAAVDRDRLEFFVP